MSKKDLFWVKLPFKDLAIETMGMTQEEKGDFLDKIIKDLSKKESDNEFINSMLAESKDFSEKKKKAAKIRWEGKKNKDLDGMQCISNANQRTSNEMPETETETETELKKENTKRKDPPVVESECMKIVELWNSIDGNSKITFPTEASRKKLISAYTSRRRFSGKEIYQQLLTEIPKAKGFQKEKWFNFRNIIGSQEKTQKLLDGVYVGFNREKPRNQTSVDLTGFYSVNNN